MLVYKKDEHFVEIFFHATSCLNSFGSLHKIRFKVYQCTTS